MVALAGSRQASGPARGRPDGERVHDDREEQTVTPLASDLGRRPLRQPAATDRPAEAQPRGQRERADIAVIGGGLAGAIAATLLDRAGFDVILIDPHETYPPDFRCEKLEQGHIEVLRKTGLAEAVIRASTCTEELWVARFGRLVDKAPFKQYGMAYEALVNAMRAEIPPGIRRCRSWADEITPGPDRQEIRLSDGRRVDVRLAVLASGANWRLREALGVRRELSSPCHSITVGFDLRRADGGEFAFPALQYNPERAGDDVAYLTLFRIGGTMRANLFLYQPLKGPRVAAFRTDPDAALRALLPGLSRLIGDFTVQGPVKVRPTDLHVMRGYEMPGVVMIGDAFATPCPATGTGSLKLFTDVERLCNAYIPVWMASPGMPVEKIRAFYEDPVKTSCDSLSVAKAYALRTISTDRSLYGRMRLWLRFYSRLARWGLRATLRRRRA